MIRHDRLGNTPDRQLGVASQSPRSPSLHRLPAIEQHLRIKKTVERYLTWYPKSSHGSTSSGRMASSQDICTSLRRLKGVR